LQRDIAMAQFSTPLTSMDAIWEHLVWGDQSRLLPLFPYPQRMEVAMSPTD
jgi:hypothetical protein